MVKQKLVVLDPGHGGWDGGLQVEDHFEKDINLAVCLEVRDRLVEAGVRVEMTRDDDHELPASKRTQMGNRADVDLFVSWHCDALTDSTVSGVSLWVAEENSNREQEMALFEEIGEAICAETEQIMLGVFVDHEKVLHGLERPAVVIKGAFLSHEWERKRCLQDAFRKRQAAGAAKGILQVLKEL
jgi:N-acetylmuramoyl-L-alanine amidase